MNVAKQYPGSGMYTITWLAKIDKQKIEYNHSLTLPEILAEICDIFGMDIEDVCSSNRKSEFVLCRKIYCFVAYTLTGHSFREIGKLINGRDHSTIMKCRNDIIGFLHVRDPRFLKQWNYYLKHTTIYTNNISNANN